MDKIQVKRNLANFTCQATGDPSPTISWYFNDIPVNKSDKYQISTNPVNYTSTSSILIVKGMRLSDVGNYTCYATNGMSTAVSYGILAVKGMYIITLGLVYLY